MRQGTGGFTLPGEAGYEELTLQLAERWGADVIRDSDGTQLPDSILKSGYGIYSTICIIRGHNEWARSHMDELQQSFLMSEPMLADGGELTIRLMDGYYPEQFTINDTSAALEYYQVFDRTSGEELPRDMWSYKGGEVAIRGCKQFHRYTVNFLAYRVWEEISMYNHVTNDWGDKERLMPVDPMYPATREYLLRWMRDWCESHPDTTVVRFTSLFYNFVWIWGADEGLRNRFTDWGSYDFTVSDAALKEFERRYGYRMTAEDFINKGKLHASHMVPDRKKRDWMNFIGEFVLELGRELIAIVHEYGKQAYVFYDDSWVGLEPYHPRFTGYGFDGIIKCVFSGFEVRLCAGVDAKVHEIRLHPYLFPVGLGGAPTFMEGGNPTGDARAYWINVRRALMRQSVQRIGLGGYLSLTIPFPSFNDYIEQVAGEFRNINALQQSGAPHTLKPRVAVLTAWGSLRSWTLSGHFHETYIHELIHTIESLAGLPLDVRFISFEDIAGGVPKDIDVIINAGDMGTAWSGGELWRSDDVVVSLTRFVHEGGAFVGIGEPSAVDGYDTVLRMAHVLGVDIDKGERVCHGKWAFEARSVDGLLLDGAAFEARKGAFLTDGKARVLLADGTNPVVCVNEFGHGRGVYIAHYQHNLSNARALLNLILMAAGEPIEQLYLSSDPLADCAYYPVERALALANNSGDEREVIVETKAGEVKVKLAPFGLEIIEDVD